jgi:hypothetical protein
MPPLQGYPKGKLHSPLFHKHMKESAETPRAELYHWYILFYLIIHIYSHPLVQYYHFCIVDGYRYFDWEESCFRWMIVCLLGVSRLDANLSTKRWFFSHFYFLSWFVFPTQLSSIYFSDNIKCFFFFLLWSPDWNYDFALVFIRFFFHMTISTGWSTDGVV